jgi:hypothetical protein
VRPVHLSVACWTQRGSYEMREPEDLEQTSELQEIYEPAPRKRYSDEHKDIADKAALVAAVFVFVCLGVVLMAVAVRISWWILT